MSSEHHFQVDLRGMIDLLSDHLYSGPQVYIRELLQNAVDALTAREKIEKDHQPLIRIEVQPASEDKPANLVFFDNGIGLTQDEVHQFLSTIGQSSKRNVEQRGDYIGQFGIGLLSCFVVCNEIVVITRSAKPDSQAVEWKGRSDGTYELRTLDLDCEPGTQVFLRAKPGCNDFFEFDFVTNTAKHFGCHLPIPINICLGENRNRINDTPPWRYELNNDSATIERFLLYGKETFEMDFVDAIPLYSETGGAEGVAFVLPFTSNQASRRTHRVYLKEMLLSEKADNLLPEWAFFVKCVINATNLRPTASREGFYEDDALSLTREELGACIRRYLFRLAKEDRERLNRIIELHYLPMKGLAVDDDDFFKMFINWLPFETSMGQMTLDDYRKENKVVRFVSTRDQFRQVSNVAAAQGICLINAGYVYDADLLQKLTKVFPDQKIEEVDISELAQDFEDLDLNEREIVFEMIRLGNVVLQPFQCEVDVRKFDPDSLPTLYTINESATFLRSIDQSREVSNELWQGVLDSLAESKATTSKARLCLNYNNPLVQRMAKLANENRELFQQVLQMLYVQAILLGHFPLHGAERQLLTGGLLNLVGQVVESQESTDE